MTSKSPTHFGEDPIYNPCPLRSGAATWPPRARVPRIERRELTCTGDLATQKVGPAVLRWPQHALFRLEVVPQDVLPGVAMRSIEMSWLVIGMADHRLAADHATMLCCRAAEAARTAATR
jgi:hypothetical protein